MEKGWGFLGPSLDAIAIRGSTSVSNGASIPIQHQTYTLCEFALLSLFRSTCFLNFMSKADRRPLGLGLLDTVSKDTLSISHKRSLPGLRVIWIRYDHSLITITGDAIVRTAKTQYRRRPGLRACESLTQSKFTIPKVYVTSDAHVLRDS